MQYHILDYFSAIFLFSYKILLIFNVNFSDEFDGSIRVQMGYNNCRIPWERLIINHNCFHSESLSKKYFRGKTQKCKSSDAVVTKIASSPVSSYYARFISLSLYSVLLITIAYGLTARPSIYSRWQPLISQNFQDCLSYWAKSFSTLQHPRDFRAILPEFHLVGCESICK